MEKDPFHANHSSLSPISKLMVLFVDCDVWCYYSVCKPVACPTELFIDLFSSSPVFWFHLLYIHQQTSLYNTITLIILEAWLAFSTSIMTWKCYCNGYISGFLKIRGSWQATIVLILNDVAFDTQKASQIQCNIVKICEFDWNGSIMFYCESTVIGRGPDYIEEWKICLYFVLRYRSGVSLPVKVAAVTSFLYWTPFTAVTSW